MKLKIGLEKIKGADLPRLYQVIAEELGYDSTDERLHYDCRKVCISKEIQRQLYKSYEALYPEQFSQNRREALLNVTMLLTMSGPKAMEELDADTVEVEEGFLFYVEKEEETEETA